jgi:hypothetical protein
MSIKSFNSFNEAKGEKWIQDAIKNPGALKKSLGKKEGEKISKSEINAELAKLKAKDKDPKKPGAQLDKKDATKKRRLELAKTLKSLKEHQETDNYMFFGNLATMKRLIDELLTMDESQIDAILNEHDWASDHISVATENLEQVFDFLAGHNSPEHDEFEHEEENEFEHEEEFGNEEAEEEFTSEEPINQEEESENQEGGIRSFQDFQS